jgi:hypothetical protein
MADADHIDDPDVEIGASVRADKLRFKRRPETQVEVHGEAQTAERLDRELDRAEVETASGSERTNLPDEVEPGETYRDVRGEDQAHRETQARRRLSTVRAVITIRLDGTPEYDADRGQRDRLTGGIGVGLGVRRSGTATRWPPR